MVVLTTNYKLNCDVADNFYVLICKNMLYCWFQRFILYWVRNARIFLSLLQYAPIKFHILWKTEPKLILWMLDSERVKCLQIYDCPKSYTKFIEIGSNY
jgi:hypothetical protein